MAESSFLQLASSSCWIISWLALSMSLVMLNKLIMSDLNFNYPAFLATSHLVFNTLCTQLLALPTSFLKNDPWTNVDRAAFYKALVPIAVLMNFSIICGNAAYVHLSVALIQMLKALSPVAVYVISCLLGLTEVTGRKCIDVCVISGGVMLSSLGWTEETSMSIILQLSAIIADAVRLAMTQKVLSSCELNVEPLALLHHLAPICSLTGLVLTIGLETPTIPEVLGIWHFGIGSCILSFCLNIAGFSVVKKTSSLTLSICGILKDLILIGLSIAIWHDAVTALQLIGYGLALVGILHYRHHTEQ
ncbi:triose-phosphate transporter family-domain-containing protein [Pseudomassariella vexata]|uniref:Triose-phosphate transporter family-domain-containing protein n=1 Tax=Pseudomassariella vexata TaxID=1141098 RepID=A0A1Y2E457_9PEZI|nr:triose-phosphate transporter family-domain-containing protein [Pseudomassariella vexata]ORY66312.1 triose-phosphate transporter family-domain-containing protein [Pseudomassariella vexata]